MQKLKTIALCNVVEDNNQCIWLFVCRKEERLIQMALTGLNKVADYQMIAIANDSTDRDHQVRRDIKCVIEFLKMDSLSTNGSNDSTSNKHIQIS